ncbi:MAG: hypothetical protein C3F02_00580 [Parcubacteria group bacterium]|nr:MAG: hypothetical protein C3F02_00580 [Parcubacteria group bacterium]
MLSHRSKIYVAITVVLAAVILIGVAVFGFNKKPAAQPVINHLPSPVPEEKKNPFSGQAVENEFGFFPVAVMVDNGWDVRPQYGLSQADIIYEALAESNITRLMAIYSSNTKVDKVGPVRSARPYFASWAEEYHGAYLHVGGSPDILALLPKMNLENVDQIGVSEIYFWREKKLKAPHNVLTSQTSWLRLGEVRGLSKKDQMIISWLFEEATTTGRANIKDVTINYNDIYKVDWKYNDKIGVYQRFQGDQPFVYDSGDQAGADNIIVQIVPSKIVDNLGRREMNVKKGGAVLIFNKFGVQSGSWENNGRTLFYNDKKEELKLVPGKTWVQVVDSLDEVKY